MLEFSPVEAGLRLTNKLKLGLQLPLRLTRPRAIFILTGLLKELNERTAQSIQYVAKI
jgi:hypothetical protein